MGSFHMDKETRSYLAGGLDKGVPFNPRKKAAEEVRVEVDFAEGELNVCERERKIVGGAALCVARKEVMGDKANHRSWRKEGRTGPRSDRATYWRRCRGRGLPTGCLRQRLHKLRWIWVFI